jgi:hypothetical protein
MLLLTQKNKLKKINLLFWASKIFAETFYRLYFLNFKELIITFFTGDIPVFFLLRKKQSIEDILTSILRITLSRFKKFNRFKRLKDYIYIRTYEIVRNYETIDIRMIPY